MTLHKNILTIKVGINVVFSCSRTNLRLGGAMNNLWSALLSHKEKLNDQELRSLLKTIHPALEQAIANWNKKISSIEL